MKKLLITFVAVVVLILATLPYFLGIQAEKSFTEQQKLLTQSNILTIESHRYQRGWFSSTETMVVRLKPSLLHNIQEYLPDNLKTVFNEPITIVNHIKHGPFANGIKPTLAYANTKFQYQPEAAKVLARFFGDDAPISMNNTINLDKNGGIVLSIPAFDYQELSGIKLNWGGLIGQINYQSGFNHYRQEYILPSLLIKLAEQGNIKFGTLKVQTETFNGKNQLALGNGHLQLDNLTIDWKDSIDYNIKINSLINLLTDLQIGAFINPTGTIAPSHVVVEQLNFDTQTNENQQWVNSKGQFKFDRLNYGDKSYGPLNIDISAEHLDSKALLILKNKMTELTNRQMSQEQIKAELIKTVKTDSVTLFTENPVLKINSFTFKMSDGDIDIKGQLHFKNLLATDMNEFTNILKKTEANLNISLPKHFLEQLVIDRAGNLFSINPEDLTEGRIGLEDINQTLKLMVDSTIQSMQREGYLTLKNEQVNTHIDLSNSQLRLNGKLFESEPHQEIDEADLLPENN